MEGGYFGGLGSVAVRVSGRRADECIVRIGVEGGPNPCWEDAELAAPICVHGNGISCPDGSS